jgi:hypothetical protein
MRPQVISLTGTGQSAWIPLDYKQSPFNVGMGCTVSGTVTYDIEHTFDDVYDASVTPIAFKNSTITGKSANFDGNYAFPIRAVRINNTAGTGTTTITLLQGLR